MESVLSRRAFLRGAAAAGAAGAIPAACTPLSPKAAPPPPPRGGAAPEDEAYWKMVRRCFLLDPAITHMNNGTLGPMPASVLRGVTERMTWQALDPDGYHCPGDRNLYARVEAARRRIAAFTGADPDEVAFTRNTTEAMNIVAAGIRMREGDEVLTTDHEHGGGLGCWEKKALREGIVLKKVKLPVPPESREQILERFEAALTPRTRLISVSHVTCTTGLRLPVKEICRMAHARGILVCVDGAQTVGWLPLDLHDLDCDFYANSPHKWLLCPMGTGFLYVKKRHIPEVEALIVNSGFEGRRDTIKKFESVGTRNLPETAAVGDAVDFLEAIGIHAVARRDYYLAARLKEGLRGMKGVESLSAMADGLSSPLTSIRLYGPDGKRLPVEAVHRAFSERHRIRVRRVGEYHLDAIRVSTHLYNSPACVDRFLEAVEDLTRNGVKGA